MLKRYRSAAIGLGALIITSTIAFAAGIYSLYPIIGGASFCGSTVSGAGAPLGGNTGQGQGTGASGVCAQTVPAGPPTFAGTEYFAVDIGVGTSSPTTAAVSLLQLGQGPVVDNNIAGAAQTIPNGTEFFVLDTNTPTTVAVTFPAVAIEGQQVHLVCGIAISVALTVVANTGQTVKGQPAGTCTAGQGFAWRYVAAANGAIVANSWLRFL